MDVGTIELVEVVEKVVEAFLDMVDVAVEVLDKSVVEVDVGVEVEVEVEVDADAVDDADLLANSRTH